MFLDDGAFQPSLTAWEQYYTQLDVDAPQLKRRHSSSDIVDASAVEDRRIRRRISNRESARRSRVRKQQHLEEVKRESDQLGSANQELSSRLKVALQFRDMFYQDNARLRFEYASLKRRLVDAQGVLMLRQLRWLAASQQQQQQQQQLSPMFDTVIEPYNLHQATINGQQQHFPSALPTGLIMVGSEQAIIT